MLLRALRKLNIGIEKYEIFPASRISKKTRDLLLARGVIAVVESPPVSATDIPPETQELFEAAGVKTLVDVIEAESVEGIQDAELKALQGEASEMLTIKVPKSKCNCGR